MYPWAKRLNQALDRTKWSVAELSRRSGISIDNLHKYLDGKVARPRGNTQDILAEALRISPLYLKEGVGPEFLKLPIAGYVGAGEAFVPVADGDGGGLGELEFNLDETDPLVIQVRGRSMIPAYRDGDRLICSRRRGADMRDCLGLDCAVLLATGEGYLKVLQPGSKPGLFTLVSYNGVYEPIEDVELQWAAPVMWVRRAQ